MLTNVDHRGVVALVVALVVVLWLRYTMILHNHNISDIGLRSAYIVVSVGFRFVNVYVIITLTYICICIYVNCVLHTVVCTHVPINLYVRGCVYCIYMCVNPCMI